MVSEIVESWGNEKAAGVVREDGARARVWWHEAQHTWERSGWRAEAGDGGCNKNPARRVELDGLTCALLSEWGPGFLMAFHTRHLGFVDMLIEAAPHGTTDRSKWQAKSATPKPDQWWHKLELGDVLRDRDEGRRWVLQEDSCGKPYLLTPAGSSAYVGGSLGALGPEFWQGWHPPLHLDPEWFKRAPVGTKLATNDGITAVVVEVDESGARLARYVSNWASVRDEMGREGWLCDSTVSKAEGLRPLSPRELREPEAQS